MPNAELVKETLTPLLNNLDNQPRTVVQRRFGLTDYARTFEEIGAELRITREQVRRMERKTLERLSEEAKPLLFSAIVQEAADLRKALISEHGAVRAEDVPSRFDSPWTDLALMACEMTTEDWILICGGEGSGPDGD